jgi:hypothetical protein
MFLPQYLFEFVARNSMQTATIANATTVKICHYRQHILSSSSNNKTHTLRLPTRLHNSRPPAILINRLNVIPKPQTQTSYTEGPEYDTERLGHAEFET